LFRPDYWQRLVDPANPKFRTFANADGKDGLSAVQPLTIGTGKSGFRSGTTEFFNYSTRLTVPAGEVGNSRV
jgi:hypothetical protein